MCNATVWHKYSSQLITASLSWLKTAIRFGMHQSMMVTNGQTSWLRCATTIPVSVADRWHQRQQARPSPWDTHSALS
uniref:Secreted protein n=1 Tax=Ascaris lumbricoides TaxID=6252 RepID=A0A0M3IDQ3_ASCLU